MSDFAGHTPGPWTYYEWRSGEYAIGAPGHHDLAEVNATDGADDVFPALANAALIAAAPTLLAQRDALAEALRDAVNQIDLAAKGFRDAQYSWSPCREWACEMDSALDRARAALALLEEGK